MVGAPNMRFAKLRYALCVVTLVCVVNTEFLTGGYEVRTEGDSFMVAFHTQLSAIWWCLFVQQALIEGTTSKTHLKCEISGDVAIVYQIKGFLPGKTHK